MAIKIPEMTDEVKRTIEQKRQEQALATQQPTTMAEVSAALKAWGHNWREEHKETKKKNGSTIEVIHRVPPRAIANKIKELVQIAVIGDTRKELEKAPLVHYDCDTGIYVDGTRQLERLILAADNTTKSRERLEIMGWLRVEAPQKRIEQNQALVPVGNGVVNLVTGQLMPFSPDLVFTNKISTNYNADATEPTFNGWRFSAWVDELAAGDPDKVTLIWQLIASTVRNRWTSNVMFALIDNGQGRTGKSTMEQLLINLVGQENMASLKLDQFEQQFLLAKAFGARLIIGDDNNPKGYIDDGSTLKSIVTNEMVLVNPKGMAPFTARFFATIVQSMNGMPRFRDTSGGLYRRFRIINFPKQYADTPANRKIKDEYIKNPQLLEWILKQALQVSIDTIVDTRESQEIVHETRLDNDPVLYFVENHFDAAEIESTRLPASFLFHWFLSAMNHENAKSAMKQNTFTKQVTPLLEERGWHKTRQKPLDRFKEADVKLIDDLDPLTGEAHSYVTKSIKPEQVANVFEQQD